MATEFPPNASGGGPAVVRQMLKDWPAAQLGWWSCLPERDQRFGQKVSFHRTARIPGKMYPQRKLPRVKSWLLENLWARWAAQHFRRTVAEFAPEAIWVIPHLWAIPPLGAAVPDSPTGYHGTMQDFRDLQRNLPQLGAGRGARLARGTERLYQKATTRDATSHPMIAELQRATSAAAAQMLHAGWRQTISASGSKNRHGRRGDAHRLCGDHSGRPEFALWSQRRPGGAGFRGR